MSVIESLYSHTFTVSRLDRVPNGSGGWMQAPVTVGSAAGRLRPASGAEREIAQQEGRELSHVLYVAAGTDIARGDTVTGAGTTVAVLGVRNPSHADHHLEIDCRERQQGSEYEPDS